MKTSGRKKTYAINEDNCNLFFFFIIICHKFFTNRHRSIDLKKYILTLRIFNLKIVLNLLKVINSKMWIFHIFQKYGMYEIITIICCIVAGAVAIIHDFLF